VSAIPVVNRELASMEEVKVVNRELASMEEVKVGELHPWVCANQTPRQGGILLAQCRLCGSI
jgi:hypothetical protein